MTQIKLNSNIILECNVDEIVRQSISDNTFENPIFRSNQQNNRSNWDTERYIKTYHFEGENIVLPRGYMRDLLSVFRKQNIAPKIVDERASSYCIYPEKLNGIELRPYQQRAVDEAMHFDQGVIVSPTGSGKTILGLEILRQRQQKTLVLVHRSDLAKQWIDVIQERMGITAGLIGDGEWELGGQITIAMIQTLSAQEERTKTLSNTFGLILVDECHHIPAMSFFDVIGLMNAKFRYSLSATLERRDGLEPIMLSRYRTGHCRNFT